MKHAYFLLPRAYAAPDATPPLRWSCTLESYFHAARCRQYVALMLRDSQMFIILMRRDAAAR